MPAKKAKPATWSKTVEKHGIRVRIFERRKGGLLNLEIRGVNDKAESKERKALGHRDRALAESEAETFCEALALAKLSKVRPDTLTLGHLFAAYRKERMPLLAPARKKEAEARITMFTDAWGKDQVVIDLAQHHVDQYVVKRRKKEVVAPGFRLDSDGKPRRGYRPPPNIRDGALHSELSWLSTVMNFAHAMKEGGQRILSENPLRDLTWPKEKNPRQPVASHQRFIRTMEHVDAVDPEGRLRCILALARYTGRRENAICVLKASDLLLSPARVRAALAEAGMNEQDGDHMPHGAIRWAAETDKQGFLFVSPINRAAREAIDAYLRQNPRVGDVPLFPAPVWRQGEKRPWERKFVADKPIGRDRAAKWLVKAEQLADLPKLLGGVFHPYRRLWATERKHLSDTDVAAAGGWRDTRALKASYQHADARSVLNVVEMGG